MKKPGKTAETEKVIKVLVAEDNDMNYKLISLFLNDRCFEVKRAENGKEAVDYCAGGFLPDIVLMDIRMPEMDGFQATKIIRTLFPLVPIIAQTAYIDERLTTQKSGFSDVIYKPYDKKKLINVLSKHIVL